MPVKIIWNYLLGYVNITVEGCFIERFINICASKNIYLWNSNREKSTILCTDISIEDFRRIKAIAKKTQCRIKINRKKGLPFLFYRYKKRKIFFILLILIFALILVSSQFIWNIEVSGNEKISTEEIIAELNKSGLVTGKNKSSIDVVEVINNVRLDRADIAWLGIDIKGTNAIVEIVEADEKPDIVDYEDYCNIVSDKEGVITKINVQNGTPMVEKGDVVRKGTILVGGWLEGKYTGTRYVHSIADIEARVWYSLSQKQELKQEIKTETGKTEEKYSIKINNFEINLYKTLSNFENYDTISESNKIKLFSNFYLPIEVTKITNYEFIKEEKEYTQEELKDKIQKELEEELDKQIENKDSIVNKQVNTKNGENDLEVELVYEVLEKIGTEEKIIY